MLFSATYGCDACLLRFARRATCPSCRKPALPLAGRGLSPSRARTEGARSASLAAGAGVLLALPAMIAERTLPVLGLAGAGVALVLYALTRRPQAKAALPPPRVRVHAARIEREGRVRIEGIARLGSIAIQAAASGETCLVFGVRAELPEHVIEDADGGDFDVELDGGERVSLSLEHATLSAPRGAFTSHAARAGDPELAAFLASRGIDPPDDASLEEVLVREGDRVVVIGDELGGQLVAAAGAGRRRGKRRVLAGREDAPLVIEKP